MLLMTGSQQLKRASSSLEEVESVTATATAAMNVDNVDVDWLIIRWLWKYIIVFVDFSFVFPNLKEIYSRENN